jgi:hypothetical protein
MSSDFKDSGFEYGSVVKELDHLHINYLQV